MKYFTIKELSRTATGLPNIPGAEEIANLEHLVDAVLDPAREAIKCPINVTSGFRNPAVNRAVGGAENSQHVWGEAADLDTADNAKLFAWIRKNSDFDQLIWEFGSETEPKWIHVSAKQNGGNRDFVLKAVKNNGHTIYLAI